MKNDTMKNDTMLQTCLTELSSPTDGQITKMEQNILDAVQSGKQPGGAPRPGLPVKAILAAAMAAVLAIAGISAAPALRQFFFPGVGVAETEAGDAPLYMIVNTEEDAGADYEILYGYWYDGKAAVQISSATKYEEKDPAALFDTADAVLTHQEVTAAPSGMIQEYRIEITELPYENMLNGIRFGKTTIRFDRMPAEYQPYTKTAGNLQLTLIPMSIDYTVFSAELCYTDREETLALMDDADTCGYLAPVMSVEDAEGRTYPLVQNAGELFFHTEETPEAAIVGFRAEELLYTCEEDTVVTVCVPERGTNQTVSQSFTYADGAPGRIDAVGYDETVDSVSMDKENDYPLGYLAVVTEAVEKDGILYWSFPHYTDAYSHFLEDYLVMEPHSPYDGTPLNPLAPGMTLGRIDNEPYGFFASHYVPDGSDTVELAMRYTAAAPGDWNIDFTRAAE